MTTVVITGASQGIGAALAKAFSEAFLQEKNIQLALVARNETKLAEVADVCKKKWGRITCFSVRRN